MLTEASIAGQVDHLHGLKGTSSSAASSRPEPACLSAARSTLEKDEPFPVQPNLEDLLRSETGDESEEALSLAELRISATNSKFYRIASTEPEGREAAHFAYCTFSARSRRWCDPGTYHESNNRNEQKSPIGGGAQLDRHRRQLVEPVPRHLSRNSLQWTA
ncbi:MAG TPA: hypothetical protein VF713_01570 [Thermoanaerobaculia bacterium]